MVLLLVVLLGNGGSLRVLTLIAGHLLVLGDVARGLLRWVLRHD